MLLSLEYQRKETTCQQIIPKNKIELIKF